MPCDKDIPEATIKVLSATGGFLGGTSMMLYMKPVSMLDAIRRVAISVISSAMLTMPIAEKFFDHFGSEVIMGTAFVIGFVSWNILGAVALYFENNKGKDIAQIVKDVKND